MEEGYRYHQTVTHQLVLMVTSQYLYPYQGGGPQPHGYAQNELG